MKNTITAFIAGALFITITVFTASAVTKKYKNYQTEQILNGRNEFMQLIYDTSQKRNAPVNIQFDFEGEEKTVLCKFINNEEAVVDESPQPDSK